MKKVCILFLFLLYLNRGMTQIEYPYPLNFFSISMEKQSFKMAYMDIRPTRSNGKTILLLHGKNFNGYYWKQLIPFLTQQGFRVIAPDQPGWGQSDRPLLHYSFHLLALCNALLLDSLNIPKVILIAHSMGGMLGIRFSLLYRERVEKLVLENPIGLEDYKTFVPYKIADSLYAKEKKATYESYKKYQQSYYPVWKPEYEPLVKAQAADLDRPDFDNVAWVNAITYQMIYEQPVIYELDQLNLPVVLVIGQADRTVVGKELLTEAQKNNHGQYPALGRMARDRIKNATLIELPGIGHIPHIQDFSAFGQSILPFLKN